MFSRTHRRYRFTDVECRVSFVLTHSAPYTGVFRVDVEQGDHSSRLILGKWTQMCRPSFSRARYAHGHLCLSRWRSTRGSASGRRTRRENRSTRPSRGSRAPSWPNSCPGKRRSDDRLKRDPPPSLGSRRTMIFYGLSARLATKS